jgi:hypothetical protein
MTKTEATIHVRIRRAAASKIKRGQFYFSIVVINCRGKPNGHPVEPYIGKEKATHFKFPLPEGDVELTGTIPIWILRHYRRPCVFLQGGSYLFGNIESPPQLLDTSSIYAAMR